MIKKDRCYVNLATALKMVLNMVTDLLLTQAMIKLEKL